MELRFAKKEDIEEIMLIIKKAQESLKSKGINQWQNGYPNEATIENDIDNDEFYVLVENKEILGITALSFEGEDTYEKIYEGEWLTEKEYGVVHRMAVDLDKKRKGLAGKILQEAEIICKSRGINDIKIDTHRKNIAMQNFLKKNNFKYCGIIYLKNGDERLAFEKILDK